MQWFSIQLMEDEIYSRKKKQALGWGLNSVPSSTTEFQKQSFAMGG